MKIYENKFIFIVTRMPNDDETLFCCNGVKTGQEMLMKRWSILAERSLIINSKGQLGLVVGGKVTTGPKLIDLNGNGLGAEKITFDASCKVNWSKAGLMKVDRKTLINLITVLEPAKFRGTCKVLVDNELVPELCFARVL